MILEKKNIYSDEYGEGILVLNTDAKSLFTNTIFKNLSSPNAFNKLLLYELNAKLGNNKFKIF